MKANLKDVFKGKSKYILILPLIFMLLFGLVMYMDKNSPAKASDSHSSVYMEPPVEDTKPFATRLQPMKWKTSRIVRMKKQKKIHSSKNPIYFSQQMTKERKRDRMRKESQG